MMVGRIVALVVQNGKSYFETLRRALQRENINVVRAADAQEAKAFIRSAEPPEIVFTDTEFPDGTWEEILRTSQEARRPLQVIVVSPYVDMNLYMEAMQQGAFDFIVPPVSDSDLAYIVEGAAWKALKDRNLPALSVA